MGGTHRRICVIGLGHVGLPTASLLGSRGYDVVGVDNCREIVDRLNNGKNHIAEPGLGELLKSAMRLGHFTARNTPVPADVFIITVPTPYKNGKSPDLSHVASAAKAVAGVVAPGNLVVLESTSPVGTTDGVVAEALRGAGHDVDRDVFVAHCPERVLPGQILPELIQNARIVGGINRAATEKAASFYAEFVDGEILKTTAAVAELAKLAENAYRDVNIAFANELSLICDRAGIDTSELIDLANHHPRVDIMRPGPGVGGHCVAVDPWFIVSGFPEEARLIRRAREVNDHKPDWVVRQVEAAAAGLTRPVIACLGLAYKADVADLRNSPALAVVEKLRSLGVGELILCDPNVEANATYDTVPFGDAIRLADIVLLLVNHRNFGDIVADDLTGKIVIDTCGVIK